MWKQNVEQLFGLQLDPQLSLTRAQILQPNQNFICFLQTLLNLFSASYTEWYISHQLSSFVLCAQIEEFSYSTRTQIIAETW